MTTSTPKQSDARPDGPFGTETRRPRWVLLLWLVLYLAFVVFLLLMAIHTTRS
jgi:hypothetical protein